MKVRVLNYIPKESCIHSLSGTTKLIIFLSFSFLCGLQFSPPFGREAAAAFPLPSRNEFSDCILTLRKDGCQAFSEGRG